MLSDAPVRLLVDRPDVVFVFGSIAERRGGLTRAVLSRIRLFADAGMQVRLLLTEHRPHEDAEEAAVRRVWSLPDSVEIRYFWREAAPGGGGFLALPSSVRGTRYTDRDGRLLRVDLHGVSGAVTGYEYYDPEGRLVRIDHVDSAGRRSMRRWIDRSGSCWLTCWLNSAGRPTTTIRHRPHATVYRRYEDCVAEWVDDVLADSPAPVVFSDTRNADRIVLAMRHPGLRRVAVLHNCHTRYPCGAQDTLKWSWRRLVARLDRFDTVVTLTHRQRDDMTERFGAGHFVVINHPAPAPEQPTVAREPGLLVAVSRLVPQKRLDHAVRAFAVAAGRLPGARFDIYGTGRDVRALKRLVAELGMRGKVRLRGYTTDPLAAFARASAAVLTSAFEGFGLVLTEGMSIGTPFVAYDINYGPSEIIRHGVDGMLVDNGDIDRLADAMVRVLAHDGDAARLGARAREVTERFSTDRWEGQWLDLVAAMSPVRKRIPAVPAPRNGQSVGPVAAR